MKKGIVRMVLIGFAVFLFLVSGYHVIKIVEDYHNSDSLYDDTTDKFVKENADSESGVEDKVWNKMIEVNLEALQEENEDIIGWIFFENEDISYPILYSGDNSTYLRTSYTHESLTAGSIFMDGGNTPDFSDMHTIIYGHNMRNLSMFGKLKYYRQKADYYKDHEYFQIITNDNYYRYKIFSYKEVDETSDIYTSSFESADSFDEFIKNTILRDSLIEADETITSDDNIITLSTCSTEGRRFTVSAKRIASSERSK